MGSAACLMSNAKRGCELRFGEEESLVAGCNEKTATMEISKTQAPHAVQFAVLNAALHIALYSGGYGGQALFAGGVRDDELC